MTEGKLQLVIANTLDQDVHVIVSPNRSYALVAQFIQIEG